MGDLTRDVRSGLRSLLGSPGFTLVAALTLALGIGANTAIFSVVDAVLLRPLPYESPDRLVIVYENDRLRGTRTEGVSFPDFLDMRRRVGTLEKLSALASSTPTLTGTGDPRRLTVARASSDYFGLLGVPPILGRSFLEEEQQPGRDGVAILGQGLWQERFGGDDEVLGRSILLDDRPHTVVGVMPLEAQIPGVAIDAWVPLSVGPEDGNRGRHHLYVLGRLRDGVPLESARSDMTSLMQQLEKSYPEDNTGRGAAVVRLHDALVEDSRPSLVLLLAAVGFVLTIGCANVSTLLLARMSSRERELAVRAALGAGRWRLVRQLLTESALLCSIGGALGLLLAHWGVDFLARLGPRDVPRLDQTGVDLRVLAFSTGVCLVIGLLAGALPAVKFSRADPAGTLHEGVGRMTAGASYRRLGGLFVAGEAAFALALLLGACLLARSLVNLQNVDPGYDPSRIVALTVELPPSRYERPPGWPILEWPAVTAFHERLLERVHAIPGVRSAAIALNGPSQAGWTTRVTVVGRPEPPAGEQEEAGYRPVSAGYFRTLGVPLKRGRHLTERDDARAPGVAIVNESFARRHFGDEEPVGRQIRIFGRPYEVVGVVGDVRYRGLDAEAPPAMYPSLAQNPWPGFEVVVRTAGDPLSLATSLRQAIWSIDPQLAVQDVSSLEQALAGSLARRRFTLLLMSCFAATALLLAALGVYGLTSHQVAERTREIGVRMALGATRADVLRMIAGQGLVPALAGIAIGLIASPGLGGLVASLLFGVGRADPITLAGMSLLLAMVAAAAAYLPARRAVRVDPMIALREQ